MTRSENPLLSVQFEAPVDRLEASDVEPAVSTLLERSRAALAAIAEASDPRTYQNTLGALEAATEELEFAVGLVAHLESVATTPELREAYNAIQGPVSEFYATIPHDAKLWAAIEAYSATPEAAALTGPRARLLQKTKTYFLRHGAGLADEQKKRLAEVDVELAKTTMRFAENVLDATTAWSLTIDTEEELAGLPDSAKQAARVEAEEKGESGFRLTLQAPSVMPVLTYCDDPKIRETVWRAYNRRGCEGETNNAENIATIIALRTEKAQILGYSDFADYALEERMAKLGANARAFVDDLRERTQAFGERETTALLEFRRELEGPDAPALQPWDVGYYAEKQREALYDFDEEQLRPYFPAPKVLDGMFETASRLYGVTIEKRDNFPVWHEDVRVYDLLRDNEHLGTFYADMHPREDKRGGAWMNSFITGLPGDEQTPRTPHLGLICANITKPLGDQPALLTHREVETLFHEFGHLLHHLLTDVPVKSLAGTNVAWDFVELPSQIMENWCWEREALDVFARHYETDEPLPDDLFDKMRRARTFRAASAQMRQLGFATLDLALHRDFDPEVDGDVVAYSRDILAQFSATPLPDDYGMICGFTHLFGSPTGYAAGYYSYKWAEVLDADAFTAFRQGGIFSREVGTRFAEHILGKGDSEDPIELYRAFMGREPKIGPLLERAGLAEESAA